MYRPYLPDPKAETATSPHSTSGKTRNCFYSFILSFTFVAIFLYFFSLLFLGVGGGGYTHKVKDLILISDI